MNGGNTMPERKRSRELFAQLSPKVLAPALTQIVAGLLLWLLTGDQTTLIVTLTGVATGVLGYAAPPAPGVRQSQVAILSEGR
jgi:hypothetical protein